MKHLFMIICLILFLFIFNIHIAYSTVIINEIMYNPSGSDIGHEWIEIYSNEPINLSGWKFYEASTNHGLTLINGSWILDGYAVIADESDTFLTDYPDFNSTLFDSSWSSLSNTGEYLAIKNNTLDIVDQVNYSTDLANGNGKSLELYNGAWNESGADGGSPGKINNATTSSSATKGLKLTVYMDDTAYVGENYTSLFKIENLDHVSGTQDSINATIGYNVSVDGTLSKSSSVYITGINSYKTSKTGNFDPTSEANYTLTGWIINSTSNDTNSNDDLDSKIIEVFDTTTILCNISINITTDNLILNQSESIKFTNNLNDEAFPFKIQYWIEDYFGNIYKSKINTTNTNQKTWKTDITETDRVLFVKSEVYPICNDTNKTDNTAEKMFIVKNANANSAQNSAISTLQIKDVDSSAKWGDTIDVDVKIYKGDTGKYSVKLLVENSKGKASGITKIHMYDKYKDYNGQLSIQLKPNCDNKLPNGNYDVVLEGLSEKESENIKISGMKKNICKEKSVAGVSSAVSGQFYYEIIKSPNVVNSGQSIETQIKIVNNEDSDSDVQVWSYVYRGSKSYSGDRTQNKRHIIIEEGSENILTLTNSLDDMETGSYKLKVLINKDNQKTDKEIIKDILVKGNSKVSNTAKCKATKIDSKVKKSKPQNLAEYNIINKLYCIDSLSSSQIIYESSNEQTKKLIPYFIILTMLILLSIIILRSKTDMLNK